MTRRDNDTLLLLLACGLEQEHRARTGHPYATEVDRLVACETCSQLHTVMSELEERNADALLADLDTEQSS